MKTIAYGKIVWNFKVFSSVGKVRLLDLLLKIMVFMCWVFHNERSEAPHHLSDFGVMRNADYAKARKW